jgi:hypothetical protein
VRGINPYKLHQPLSTPSKSLANLAYIDVVLLLEVPNAAVERYPIANDLLLMVPHPRFGIEGEAASGGLAGGQVLARDVQRRRLGHGGPTAAACGLGAAVLDAGAAVHGVGDEGSLRTVHSTLTMPLPSQEVLQEMRARSNCVRLLSTFNLGLLPLGAWALDSIAKQNEKNASAMRLFIKKQEGFI